MKLRFGIIGCGNIATSSYAPSLLKSERAELTAVCRRNLEKAREFAGRFGCPAVYASAEELVADESVDALIISTPPNVHYEQTLLAARHGKHVLCEKPMAMNAQECRAMIDTCRKAGVKLAVAYRRRLFPQIVKAKDLITQGAIGDVVCVRTHYSGWYHDPAGTSWLSRPETGILVDMAVHRIEVLLNFAGQPAEVSAFVETVRQDSRVNDSCALLLKFDDRKVGVHSTIMTSPPRHDFAQIDGTKGRLLIDPMEFYADHITLEMPEGTETIPVTPLEAPYFDLPMIEDFIDAIHENREPVCDAASGYWTQAVVDAMYRSAREKKVVAVEALTFIRTLPVPSPDRQTAGNPADSHCPGQNDPN